MSVEVALNLAQALAYIFVARSARNFVGNRKVNDNLAYAGLVLCYVLASHHIVESVRLCVPFNPVVGTLSEIFETCMPLLPIIGAVLVAVSTKYGHEKCIVSQTEIPLESAATTPCIERTESTQIRPSATSDTEHTAELYTLNLPHRDDVNKNIEVLEALSEDDSLSESSADSVVKSFVRSPRPRGDTDARHEEERITRAKLEYIARTAHDLRTPLQTFHLSLELLRESELTATQEDILHQAAVAADLMKLTVNQALDVETVLGGAKLVPHRSAVSISATLERVNNIINGFGRSVPVSFEVMPGVVDSVFTDEEWLWQNLVSLLTNAAKNTTEGSIRVVVSTLKKRSETLDLTVPSPRSARSSKSDESKDSQSLQQNQNQSQQSPSQQSPSQHRGLKSVLSTATVLSRIASAQSLSISTVAQQLRFEVFDTGLGIDSDKLATMFDAFSQVHDDRPSTGTGLGLFGVRTRAEGLLGSCGARPNTESSTGTGTVVWFSVPYQPDTTTETPKKKSPVSVADMFTADESVDSIAQRVRDSKLVAMVVEDTLTIRKLMQRLLLKMGFARVDCYENGSKGLDAMMAEPVDIVFSDVQMPVMTGDEMVNKFRLFEEEALRSGARPSRQLVVAVTANGAEWGSLNKHGFDCVCPKPVATGELSRIIAGYLNTLEDV